MIIQMFEKKLSDSYFSYPAHIYVNLDSLPFCTWKQNIETDSTLRQKTILDALFLQRSQEFNLVENVTQEQKSHRTLSHGLLCVADAKIE